MIPSPWVSLVLALGTLRVVRICGWDTFPPIVRVRGWLLGTTVSRTGSQNSVNGLTSEQVTATVTYRRPVLAELLECAFCQGWWWSVAAYVAWRLEPSWTVAVLAPFALSMAVGLAARWLDP